MVSDLQSDPPCGENALLPPSAFMQLESVPNIPHPFSVEEMTEPSMAEIKYRSPRLIATKLEGNQSYPHSEYSQLAVLCEICRQS